MKRLLFLLLITTAFAQEPAEVALQQEIEKTSFSEAAKPISVPEISLKMKKDPDIATTLSSLFPGLGHFYLDDSKTAGSLMGAGCMELGALAASLIEHRKEAAIFSLLTFVNTLNYGVYAAYRDARASNSQELYHYKMPTEQLQDLTAAPFNWKVIKKPEVWGGCLGAIAVAVTVSYFAFPPKARIAAIYSDNKKIEPWFPAVAFPVGIGEEAFFRGVMQSSYAEKLGPKGSIIASSLFFGAAHFPNAFLLPREERWRYYTFSIPLLTAIGGYLGWLTQKNGSLKESVAVHTWYDFALFSASAIAQSAAIGCPAFSYSVPF